MIFRNRLIEGDFNSANRFYKKHECLNEVKSTEIIAEHLNLRLKSQGITINSEYRLKGKRCDFTASKLIGERKRNRC